MYCTCIAHVLFCVRGNPQGLTDGWSSVWTGSGERNVAAVFQATAKVLFGLTYSTHARMLLGVLCTRYKHKRQRYYSGELEKMDFMSMQNLTAASRSTSK